MPLSPKHACSHEQTTLVQSVFRLFVYDDEGEVIGREDKENWFAAWQCDECGAVTSKPVTPDDLDAANDAPWLDEDSYLARMRERLDTDTGANVLQFAFLAQKSLLKNGKNGHK
jgi:YD repeat-containing protein